MFARGCTNSINNQLSKGRYSINFKRFFNFLLHTICLRFSFFLSVSGIRVRYFSCCWFFVLLLHRAQLQKQNTINFYACGSSSVCAFCIMGIHMNVTIKWAIQIYRITHICMPYALNSVEVRFHKDTAQSLLHILWFIYLWDSNEIYRILENNRKSFIRSFVSLSLFFLLLSHTRYRCFFLWQRLNKMKWNSMDCFYPALEMAAWCMFIR